MLTRLEKFLASWLARRIVRQGYDHKKRIMQFLSILREETARELCEDNTIGIDTFLDECMTKVRKDKPII